MKFKGLFLVLFFYSLIASAQQAPQPPVKPQIENSTIQVYKGTLPNSKEYWDYNTWYKEHAVLSVVVSGNNKEDLIKVLEDLKYFKKNNVAIGKIVVVGADYFFILSAKYNEIVTSKGKADAFKRVDQGTMNKVKGQGAAYSDQELEVMAKRFQDTLKDIKYANELSEELKLPSPRFQNPEDLIKKLNIEYSPTWIVRYRGEDYIYEGQNNIKRLFTGDGKFNAGFSE